jgi:hypothetical protein
MLHRIALFALLVRLSTSASWAGDWIPLFDGSSLRGWTRQNGDPVEAGAWEVVEGALHLDPRQGRGGNIVTQREYGDFELVFEWKIAPRANSGIKYRVKDFDGRLLGCEYQIIDDRDYGGLRDVQRTASLYDLYAPRPHHVLRPPGEFNRSAIVVSGSRIEHWLNGHQLVNVTVGDGEWQQRVAGSKFADADGFGENRAGRIMLTDHGDEVWYRNVFLRPRRSAMESGPFIVGDGSVRADASSSGTQCGADLFAGHRRRFFRKKP